MRPRERIRALELQIHNSQPHLSREVVCLMALVEYQEWAYDHPQVPLLSASGEYLGRQEFSKEPSEGALDTMTGVPTVPPLPPIPAPGAK